MKIQTYQQATEYLFSKSAFGMKLGLENIRNLLKRLNHPERTFPTVHVAGTNGKGSTAAILESILRAAGNKTGLYTSPHLIDMRERIRINGRKISKKEVLERILSIQSEIEATGVSFFEILTALAFLHFARNNSDIAVLETGLGGRLDATNTVSPLLTLITEIGLEHTRILGRNLESIAGEKAGILKPGVTCLCGTHRKKVMAFFSQYASENGVPLHFVRDTTRIRRICLSENGSQFDCDTGERQYKGLRLNLLGSHQVDNAAMAISAVDALEKGGWSVSESAVRHGLAHVEWPGRLQLLHGTPRLLVDAAHNPLGVRSLIKALRTIFEYDRLILVFGVLADKNYRYMICRLAPLAHRIILTRPLSHRALDPEKLSRLKCLERHKPEPIPEINEAMGRAMQLAGTNDLVCAAGSIYLIGEVLRLRKYRI